MDTLLSLSITHVSWWFYVDTLKFVNYSCKLVVLCGYSVKFVNYSCKLVVLCGYFVNYSCKVGGFMWIFCCLSITQVKLVVLCGYSVEFLNNSCKLVVLCGYS